MTDAITPVGSNAIELNLPGLNSNGVNPIPAAADLSPRATNFPVVPATGATLDARAASASKPPAATEQQLKSAAAAIAGSSEAKQTDLRFQIDKVTQQLVMSVIDSKDGRVLLQVPGPEALSIAQSLETRQLQLLDRKA